MQKKERFTDSRAYKRFQDISIKRKLYLCIVIFIIIPLLFAGFFLNRYFSDYTVNRSCDSLLQILKQSSLGFEFMIGKIENLSLLLIGNDDIQNFTRKDFFTDSEEAFFKFRVSIWLNEHLGTLPEVESLSINKENRIIFQYGKTVLHNDPDLLDKSTEMEGLGFWSEDYITEYIKDSGNAVSFYRGIFDFMQLGNPLAVMKINVSEAFIRSLYQNVNTYDGGKIFVTNAKNTIISSIHTEDIGQNITGESYSKENAVDSYGYIVRNSGIPDSTVLYYDIPGTQWRLIESIPTHLLVPSMQSANIVLTASIGLCILFGLIFSLVQNRFVSHPIENLLKEMEKIEQGNFDVKVHRDSQDEIGQLNRRFNKMSVRLKRLINDVYISKIKQRESELNTLESQINPHFLYNTLDSIRWVAVKNRDYETSDQLEALSELFRQILRKGRDIVTIKEEIELLETYMYLQKAKYRDRIQMRTDIDKELMSCRIPKLILQPLVENSIVHGLESKENEGMIFITIKEEDGCILLTVEDNGIGTDENEIRKMLASEEETHNVFALKNIDQRVKIVFGEEYGLTFSSQMNSGTCVETRIPMNRETDPILNTQKPNSYTRKEQ